MKTKFINAKVITNNDDFDVIENGVVIVNNNLIEYVGVDNSVNTDNVINCNGSMLMPGLINGYTCTEYSNLDTSSVNSDVDLINLINKNTLNGDSLYNAIVSCYKQMLSAGITCVVDLNFDPITTAKAMGDVGIRGVVGVSVTDENELVDILNNLKQYDNVLVTMFVNNMYNLTEKDFANYLKLCKKYNLPFTTIASQTLQEVGECVTEYNATPVELLESYGMFDIPCIIIGGTYIDKEEMQILNNYNVSVITTPNSDLMLGYGIAPICAYIKNNINVGIGTGTINVIFDMFKEMYSFIALQKGTMHNFNVLSTTNAFMSCTKNVSNAYNILKTSVLQKDNFADIIMVQGSNRTCNSYDDIVYFGSSNSVKLTMVNGNIVYHNNN